MNVAMHVPIYVSVLGEDGITDHLLLEKSTPPTEGHFYCTAVAPNGLRSEGNVDQLSYGAVRSLFKRCDELALVVDPGTPQPEGADIPDVGLRLWSSDGPIVGGQDLIAVREKSPWGVSIDLPDARASHSVNHVQIWSRDGAVTVTAWPDGGTLFPMPGLADAQRRVRPIALGQDLECSAYWGFVRHTVSEAARVLGHRICNAVASSSELDNREDKLIVAAHYLLLSSPPVPDAMKAILAQLEMSSDVDTAILRWAIIHDGLVRRSDSDFLAAFQRALLGLRETGCRHTEVFRQFVRRLDGVHEFWRRQETSPELVETVEEAIHWSTRLAKATYWDAEYLTYRALEPNNPDATANEGQLPIDAKKKSAVLTPPY